MKAVFFFLSILLFLLFPLAAAEYSSGALKLLLHEDSGRFSLYFSDGANQGRPLPLFADQDPRTSFLSVFINDRAYKMGDTSTFAFRIGGTGNAPSFIFESSFMTVIEEFSFVTDPLTGEANGVSVKITLENHSDRRISAGARFLLDTSLGEGASHSFFSTSLSPVNSETLVTGAEGGGWWADGNERLSLFGSLVTGGAGSPDSVLFANWKKLNDVSWKAPYQQGRNFNYPPYSTGDGAVCYYFEPRLLDREEKVSFGFILAAGAGVDLPSAALLRLFGGEEAVSVEPVYDLPDPRLAVYLEEDLAAIREIIEKIDSLIASPSASEEEIAALEFNLNRLRAKYGANFADGIFRGTGSGGSFQVIE